MKPSPFRGGYIALMSAIIIAVVLMGLMTTLSLSGFFGRFNILYSEFKERSFAAAEGCANAALIKLGADAAYPGNEDLKFGTDTCHVFPLETSGSRKVIKAQGVFQNAYSNLKVTVDPATLAVESFQEVATLP